MVKSNNGFTLLEVIIGLGIVSLLALSVIPNMSAFLDKQVLKVNVSRLNTYVDRARNLAAVTECPVLMKLQPGSGAVNINVSVEHDSFMRGCTSWYSQSNGSSNRTFSASLDNVTLTHSTDLRFNAVSGVLNTNSQALVTLKYKDKLAAITYLGIGNGVVSYD